MKSAASASRTPVCLVSWPARWLAGARAIPLLALLLLIFQAGNAARAARWQRRQAGAFFLGDNLTDEPADPLIEWELAGSHNGSDAGHNGSGVGAGARQSAAGHLERLLPGGPSSGPPEEVNGADSRLGSAEDPCSLSQCPRGPRRRESRARHRGRHYRRAARMRPRRYGRGPPSDGPQTEPVCGSDGRLYASLCQLQREACARGARDLHGEPLAFCRGPASGAPAAEQPVRFVELEGSCDRAKYESMKWLLRRQFQGDIPRMFAHFDTNQDSLIAAHELWPQESAYKTALYARIDFNSIGTAPHLTRAGPEKLACWALNGTKCWSNLDPAFAPQYPPNPCSLSHLMLYDLDQPDGNFTLASFEHAFGDAGSGSAPPEQPNSGPLSQAGQAFSEQPPPPPDANNAGEPLEESRSPITRMMSNVEIGLAQSVDLDCLAGSANLFSAAANFKQSARRGGMDDNDSAAGAAPVRLDANSCSWTRNNLNIAFIPDASRHLSFGGARTEAGQETRAGEEKDVSGGSILRVSDAQLYLSGLYKCSCGLLQAAAEQASNRSQTFEHSYYLRVSAAPSVRVSPKLQWSLIQSRAAFECHYDYIDTSQVAGRGAAQAADSADRKTGDGDGQFGLRVQWFREEHESQERKPDAPDSARSRAAEHSPTPVGGEPAGLGSGASGGHIRRHKLPAARSSVSLAGSRLLLQNLTLADAGHYVCQVSARQAAGRAAGLLRVQDGPKAAGQLASLAGGPGAPDSADSASTTTTTTTTTDLWVFHDNGISVYRLANDDGQEIELLREINGHSPVSAEVDGNWNQLTLCGGLNAEQVVICEWSDNALSLELAPGAPGTGDGGTGERQAARKYIYIGQPNLNRIVVMDGAKMEIVAIINTEPQPRRLHLYSPNKIHLTKWLRRRLSPRAHAQWLSSVGRHAHSLSATPESRLYSLRAPEAGRARGSGRSFERRRRRSRTRAGRAPPASGGAARAANQRPSALIQHDIWLLCYGQPLIVDPSGDEHLEDTGRFYSASGGEAAPYMQPDNASAPAAAATSSQEEAINESAAAAPGRERAAGVHYRRAPIKPVAIQPFTPRLALLAPAQFAWRAARWPSKEFGLRNRKSVHIIQSTFLQRGAAGGGTRQASSSQAEPEPEQEEAEAEAEPGGNLTLVGEFKRSSVLTTHHIFAGPLLKAHSAPAPAKKVPNHLNRAQFDLIQNLYVPQKPHSLEAEADYKIHYAYVTHYNDRRLFRISMDEYRYDCEIDLQNCDPIDLIATAQGLLVIQCRAPAGRSLLGQLVLDQLSNARLEFNAKIQAQESYLTPDNRYLISIFTNNTYRTEPAQPAGEWRARRSSAPKDPQVAPKKAWDGSKQVKQQPPPPPPHKQSIIYVQSITTSGLNLEYEIKTLSLEITQCSFVWKDGYYAAILVSTNRLERQSEILSLRVADGRLELTARVPGLINLSKHKNQLVVSQELQLAALSTNQGTYVVDLEENRILQSLRYYQSPPTLLWV